MAGYDDTRQKILETLMQRPNGTMIQPENHQDFALNLLDYIRSVELITASTLIGVAYEDTVPVQSNDANEAYIAGVEQQRSVIFQNFRDVNGESIIVNTDETGGKLVILVWNRQYWTKTEVPINLNLSDGSVTFEKLDETLKEAIRNIELLSSGESPLIVGKIDVSELDLSWENIHPIVEGKKPLRYIVTAKDFQANIVGVLDMFSDNSNHVLTQVLNTHYTLDADGNLQQNSHRDDIWFTYTRSFNISAPNLNVPYMTWGKWKEAYWYKGQVAFMGIAKPTDTPPALDYGREMCYIATEAGTYTNFLAINSETFETEPITLADGEVALIRSQLGFSGDGEDTFEKIQLTTARNQVGVITESELDLSTNLGSSAVYRDVMRYVAGGAPMYYILMDDVKHHVTGLLLMSADDSGHALHQTLITSRTLTEDGKGFLGHYDYATYTYQRTLYLSTSGGDEQYKWSAWQKSGNDDAAAEDYREKFMDTGINDTMPDDLLTSVVGVTAKSNTVTIEFDGVHRGSSDGYQPMQSSDVEVTLPAATGDEAGVMTGADKQHLDNIQNVFRAGGKGGFVIPEPDIEQDVDYVQVGFGFTADSGDGLDDGIVYAKIPAATQTEAGVMSASDKTKLDNIVETEYVITASTEEIEALFN